MQVYACMELYNMLVLKYTIKQVCKYARMQICKYTNMQVCKYASMQICKCLLLFSMNPCSCTFCYQLHSSLCHVCSHHKPLHSGCLVNFLLYTYLHVNITCITIAHLFTILVLVPKGRTLQVSK